MKKHFLAILPLLCITAALSLLTACGNGDDEDYDEGNRNYNEGYYGNDDNDHSGGGNNSSSNIRDISDLTPIDKQLIDTKWRLLKKDTYHDSKLYETSYDYNGVLEFSKYIYPNHYFGGVLCDVGRLYIDGMLVGYWDSGNITYDDYYYDELSDAYGIGDHHTSNYSDATTTWTLYLSGNTMQFKEERTFKVYYTPYKKETVYWRYNLVEKGALNQQLNGGSSTGGGESSDGTPRIGFYDFTSTQSSVTVKYQIYNREEANVSSARIYYGTTTNPSSSVSATVSGVYITATISGLSRGTQYYVKCKATGSGGSTETDVTKVMTLY